MNPTTTSRPKVLVMHALRPTSRQTTIDHLESFREHLPNADVQYLHFQQPLPKEFEEISPDLFIVNYDFLNYRFTPLWPYIKNRHKKIAQRAGKVVAIAQDDFWANKLLDNWCMDWEVDRILTASETGWELLYPRSHGHIQICESLTGYSKSRLAPDTYPIKERSIDLGQRVREMSAHIGRIGQLKAIHASAFAVLAENDGFRVDVSTRVEDSFIGKAWFNFLSSCRFTIGMKGGASLIDPYGLTYTKVQSLKARNPAANYHQIEAACFRRKSQETEFVAVSPRIFESASAGVCQILPPTNYLHVLNPWEHYLPLNLDLSNSAEVLSAMRDLDMCQTIADRAKNVLIESGNFDYSKLVSTATDGLINNRCLDNSVWHEFISFKFNASLLQRVSEDLHDVTQVYIQNRTTSKTMVRDVNSRSIDLVLHKISERCPSKWLEEQIYQASKDKCFQRSVWPWRDLIAT